jgi:hypothetical protein
MTRSAPYLIPDEDVNLNSALLLLVIFFLGRSVRGIPLLNNDRLLIFMYLIKNPVILDNVLEQVGRREIVLTEAEAFSVNSITVNLDPLFDRDWLKSLLMRLAAVDYIEATYRKADGFVYLLTQKGDAAVEEIKGVYFERIRTYLSNLQLLRSEPTSNLNKLINNIFRH